MTEHGDWCHVKKQVMDIQVLNGIKLDAVSLSRIRTGAIGLAVISGAVERLADNTSNRYVEVMPMTLFPSVVPTHVMNEIRSLQPHFNTMIHRLSNDHDFLSNSLKRVIQTDVFTRKCWEIYMDIFNNGTAQPFGLGIFRNDFMLMEHQCPDLRTSPDGHATRQSELNSFTENCNTPEGETKDYFMNVQAKQVEINTMAIGAGGMLSSLRDVHRYSLTQAGKQFNDSQLPCNSPIEGIADGLIHAWTYYGLKSAVILCVKQEGEVTPDQRWVEKAIFNKNRRIRMIYRSFRQLSEEVKLISDMALSVNGETVAVVYYRVGYLPSHYPSQKEYDVRLLMERSRAVKCPPINYQLSQLKKIQQVLYVPGNLERFIHDPDIASRIRKTFMPQYTLDMTHEGDKNVAMAMTHPNDYVLKPQLEGGGSNFFEDKLKRRLAEVMHLKDREQYILMKRIYPVRQANILLTSDKLSGPELTDAEIGVFGVIFRSASDVRLNAEIGYSMKSKLVGVTEGGLSSGNACLDSAFLI